MISKAGSISLPLKLPALIVTSDSSSNLLNRVKIAITLFNNAMFALSPANLPSVILDVSYDLI